MTPAEPAQTQDTLDVELAAYLAGLNGCDLRQAADLMYDRTDEETRAYLVGFYDRETGS